MNEQYKRHVLSRKAEHRPYDFDQYYDQVGDETFKSVIIPVDPPTADAMVSYYQQRYNGRVGALSASHVASLETLRSSVATVMDRRFDGGRPVFCRMTNRSPKDGVPGARHMDELRRCYRETLEGLEERARVGRRRRRRRRTGTTADRGDDDDATSPPVPATTTTSRWEDGSNLRMVAACAAQLRSLRCDDADDVMDLLLSSERVFVDTLLALDCRRAAAGCDNRVDGYGGGGGGGGGGEDEWSTHLVLREWNDGVRGEWEFRAFVHDGRLTAVSQYNHYCVFPDLIDVDEGRLLDEIVSYWKLVRSRVEAATRSRSYVLDLAKLADDDDGTWRVIELNPFATTTGASLFDWVADRDILTAAAGRSGADGPGPRPELRIRRELCDGLEEYLQDVLLPTIFPPEAKDEPSWLGPWTDFLVVSGDGDLVAGGAEARCTLL